MTWHISGKLSKSTVIQMLTTADGVHVSLSLTSPAGDLRRWCERLGFTPGRFWVAGQPRSTPKGRPLAGVNEFSYCVCELPNGKYELEDVFELISERFDQVRSKRSLSLSDHPPKAKIRLTFGDDFRGVDLSPSKLSRLGADGIDVTIDRYSAPAAT